MFSATTPAPETQPLPPSIEEATPTLLCVPDPIAQGESALVFWACRDESRTTRGENIDTNENPIGSVRVNPQESTTYTVECVNGDSEAPNTASSCTIGVVKPALALVATPSRVVRGRTTTLSWKTKDMRSCVVTSQRNPSFIREGIEGDVVSPSVFADDVFRIVCETATGAVQEKRIRVEVQ